VDDRHEEDDGDPEQQAEDGPSQLTIGGNACARNQRFEQDAAGEKDSDQRDE
jgi:hypothetical protein